jgi:5-(carboxyamino)imidazole ribonucleotide synthase
LKALLPGATVGILGGGQLARMMALEARRMGYRIAVLDPDPEGPAAQVADHCEAGAFDDVEAALRLAERSDVLTLDTEHIPSELLEKLEPKAPVRPDASILGIVQDRFEQRRFLDAHDLPQAAHQPVDGEESLRAATRIVGFPCILKTRRSGYDGKGQARLESEPEVESAWRSVDAPSMLEAFVDFEKEISVLLARDLEGNVRFYEIPENTHERHILHTCRVPARIPKELAGQARRLGRRIADALGHVGVMAVEMFVTREGGLLVNEIAPRTHNSGHYTFGACVTSQFEQHVRAVCGLPLGDTTLLSPAVMVNLLGDLWLEGTPTFENVLSNPKARLHLYGKARPFSGRKMGHVLVLDEDLDRAMELACSYAR